MQVKKRSGKLVDANYHLITKRISTLAATEPVLNVEHLDPSKVSQKVIAGLYNEITTEEIDQLAAEIAGSMTLVHPDYGKLASRILVSNLHKTTPEYMEAFEGLLNYIDPKTGKPAPLIAPEILEIVQNNEVKINSFIDYNKDYSYTYFGMRTLMKSYLLKCGGKLMERPQTMLLRVAVGIWGDNMVQVEKSYKMMSDKLFTHATPTLFNAGTTRPQLSSCFLIANKGDSLEGIMDTAKDVSKISSLAGGIGLHVHDVRSKGSYIKGSGGQSNGLLPLLKTYNELAKWWDQGGGKRKGSFAIYLEPWHPDIFTLLDIRKNHGNEAERARDLFPAMWMPDLFMERLAAGGEWTLMDPNECPGLSDVYGEEFKELYESYEAKGMGRKTIMCKDLMEHICTSQIETGTPYMVYKDAANEKSNQKNLGTIKSSNLCCEIIEYSSPTEQAVCNLGSIAVNSFANKINKDKREYDFEALWNTAYQLTKNLNQVIDKNLYPTPETKTSNNLHRPIGIGIQGLADAYAIMGFAFDSEFAMKMNDDIFETIYNAALTASCDIAKELRPYTSFEDSPASEGILQYDMWGKTEEVESKGRYDWKELKRSIMENGLRNSLLLAPMPTASTAQILGNNECFEPFTSNLYTRRVLSGEYIIVNNHMVEDLMDIDVWNNELVQKLMAENGSIMNIPEVPLYLKERYKTVWEMSPKVLIQQAADRGKYICQSQSMNLFMGNPTVNKIASMHMHSWKSGLKTGMYYLRTQAATQAIQFTVDKKVIDNDGPSPEEIQCSIDNQDDCMMCSG